MSVPQPIRTPAGPGGNALTGRRGGLVEQVNPLEEADWDARMAAQPDATFFHGTAWARVLAETYGFSPMYLVAARPGGLPGVLPLMEVNSWLTGRRGVGLPFTDECEPLCGDGETFQALWRGALELGGSRGWNHVECRGGRRFFGGAPVALAHCTHSVRLLGDEQALFAGLEGSVRRAIRKAGKEGVTVEVSQDWEAVKIFYRLLGMTRQRHGLPPQPLVFFRSIHRHILSQNKGVVVVARKGHTHLGAAVYFRAGDRAIYKYGASDARFQQWRGNNVVMWEAIKWCVREGVRSLHLGRTSLGNAGLRKFKLGWGAEEGNIAYYKFDLPRQQFVVERDETEGWHNRLFRRAPLLVARAAGRLLYRHWA